MTWMVTGGAGYIGSHVMQAFVDAGIPAIAVDNLWSGKEQFLPDGAELFEIDICNTEALTTLMTEREIEGVVHIAGYKYAGESVKNPLFTYRNNVQGTASVLDAMEAAGTKKIVFSSSAGVYGTAETDWVTEDAPTKPESPYGESKLIGEWLIKNQAKAVADFQGVALRYFNVVGSGSERIWDVSPYNLFPIVLRKLIAGEVPMITGTDFPTPDGTCVRDYVHVADLATTHVAAAKALADGKELLSCYNLGSGTGLSVRQIMDTFASVTGIDFKPVEWPRRPGDPAKIVADGSAATRDLGWANTHSIEEMVESAWKSWPRD